MILAWMVYSSLIALLLALAGRLLEPVTRQRGFPVRGLWLAALLGSLLLPPVIARWPRSAGPAPGLAPTPLAGPAPVASSVAAEPEEWTILARPVAAVARPVPNPWLDRWLVAAWALASATVVLAWTVSYRRLVRRRAAWATREVDGREVWVSQRVGPAVLGYFPARIVLPRWLLDEREDARAMALAHEEEHIRAGDSTLLLAAFVVAVALPWNAGVWWIWRSLRRAVEIDCDLRVLARGVDPRAYGRLLVQVMERGLEPRLMLTGLSESPSLLERRVHLMLAAPSRRWPARAAGALLLAGACVFAACQVEQPSAPAPLASATFDVAGNGALTQVAAPAVDPSPVASPGPAAAQADPLDHTAIVRAAVQRYFPNLLTEKLPAESVTLYLLADTRGEMVRTAVDTEKRSGSCTAILQARLGIEGRGVLEGGGCGGIGAGTIGPNRLFIYFGVVKAEGAAVSSPTGPFLFLASAARGRPTEEQFRGAIERFYPEVLRDGLPYGEALWFVADAAGRVLHNGRGLGFASSTTAMSELEAKLPGVKLRGITMSSSVKAATGERIDLVWATAVETGALAPPPPPAAGQIRSFVVTSSAPGQEVTVRLAGEAADNPNAFRVLGPSTREGTLLRATTPFTFLVASPAPFSATISSRSGELDIATQADGRESRMRTTALVVRRDGPGAAITAAPPADFTGIP